MYVYYEIASILVYTSWESAMIPVRKISILILYLQPWPVIFMVGVSRNQTRIKIMVLLWLYVLLSGLFVVHTWSDDDGVMGKMDVDRDGRLNYEELMSYVMVCS